MYMTGSVRHLARSQFHARSVLVESSIVVAEFGFGLTEFGFHFLFGFGFRVFAEASL